jgi:hypothetical protein
MAETFPTDWRDQPCFLAVVPKPLVPYVGGLLKILEQRGFWLTEADYERGYTAVIELEACLMATCLQDLIESNNRLYRMLDTGIYGREYTIESTDPLVVTPDIPAARPIAFEDQDSLLGRLDRLTQLLDNTFNAASTSLYSYSPSVKEQLQSILDALTTDSTDLGTVITDLELIIGALA